MARTLEQIIAGLPDHRRKHIEDRAAELMTLRDSRQAMPKTSGRPGNSIAHGAGRNISA